MVRGSVTAGAPHAIAVADKNGVELLLRNARVRSGPRFGDVQLASVAIGGGAITAVGPESDEWVGPDTTTIDLEGALVLPGFVDCHTHLGWAGEGFWRVNWSDDVTDHAAALECVRRVVDRLDSGFWLLGGDWSRDTLPDAELPSLEELDALTGQTPTFLCSEDASLALVNSSALASMRVEAGRRLLPSGVETEASGRPNGRLVGPAARARATRGIIPPADRFRRRAELRATVRELARHGITEAHDIASPPDPGPTPAIYRERSFTDASLYDDLASTGELSTRIGYRGYLGRWADIATHVASHDLISCLGLKELLDDGRYSAPGMDFGYEFRYPGRDVALDWMRGADRAGLDVTLHAMGDLAVTEALDLFEEVQRGEPAWARRPRLVHGRRIAPADIGRIVRLGVIVEAQPWDSLLSMPRLATAGDDTFMATASPFRSLLDAGARVVFSSDWRLSPRRLDGLDMDPLVGMYAAVTRQLPFGGPVWRPEQRISIAQALAAYTTTAAWAAGAENRRGVVAAGMDADLVVLSRDVLTQDVASLLETRVLMTIVAGRVVYARD
jgi:predicted amidohydrolase YtcJ